MTVDTVLVAHSGLITVKYPDTCVTYPSFPGQGLLKFILKHNSVTILPVCQFIAFISGFSKFQFTSFDFYTPVNLVLYTLVNQVLLYAFI